MSWKVNYVYFSLLLFCLGGFTLVHFFSMPVAEGSLHLFFLCYAALETALEIFLLLLIGFAIFRYCPRFVYILYIALSFLLLLCHIVDFTLVRLMDASFSYALTFFAGSSLNQLIVALRALNLSQTMLFLLLSSSFLVPALGIFLYFLLKKASDKKPLPLNPKVLLWTPCFLALGLLGLALFTHPTSANLSRYKKALPLGAPFLSPTTHLFSLEEAIAPFVLSRDPGHLPLLSDKPNLYFFIVETLRRDAITRHVTPSLAAMQKETFFIERSFANSNATHNSWYAIFHARLPHTWTSAQSQSGKGALPLALLKRLGYEIEVLSSADLSYFGMDDLLFGKERALANRVTEYTSHKALLPCERDHLAFSDLQEKIKGGRKGKAFFIFLDTTHSEYAIPASFPPLLTPTLEKIDYLAIAGRKGDLTPLKNRYLNAVHYVDTLFGTFFAFLKEEGLYDEALIAITGDHGEEFFEEGALFHGTHLNKWQTEVPILLKLGLLKHRSPLASHIDLFPTILSFLTNQNEWRGSFDGESLLGDTHRGSVLSVQHRGSLAPTQFALTDGDLRLVASFTSDARQISLIHVEKEGVAIPEEEWDDLISPRLLSPLIADHREN